MSHNSPPLLACVASGSARVRRENWNESKKRNEGGGGGEWRNRFKFRARLETLATQATPLYLNLYYIFRDYYFTFSLTQGVFIDRIYRIDHTKTYYNYDEPTLVPILTKSWLCIAPWRSQNPVRITSHSQVFRLLERERGREWARLRLLPDWFSSTKLIC